MRRIKWIGLLCGLLPFMVQAQGEVITPRLILEKVKAIKTLEKKGDEIYVDINVYQPNKQINLVRVPEKPNHWPTAYLENIKQVPLWSAPLKPGESTTLIVSLVDSDDFILNPDDLIGSIRLDLKNENGTLQTNWSIPNRNEQQTQQSLNAQKFLLQNDESQYEVYLTLK